MLPVLGPRNDVVTHRLALPRKHVAAAIETVWASAQPAVKLVFRLRLTDKWRTIWFVSSIKMLHRAGDQSTALSSSVYSHLRAL